MRIKKLGAALFVLVALSALLSSSAFGAAVTEDVKWYMGAAPGTELSGSETVSTEQVGSATFATTVAGQEVVLHATGTECVGCKIENSGGKAVGSGQLKFTGVTVEKPAKCTTSSSITTKALSITPDWMIGTTNYWKFVPTAGEESGFFTFELTGPECALKTAIVPKGNFFVQAAHLTGTASVAFQVDSSGAINLVATGNLHVGVATASLTATWDFKNIGPKLGFGISLHF